MGLFSWDSATLLMHFCASLGLSALCQPQAWSWSCLYGCSPAPHSRMLWERHPVTVCRGHPEPPVTDAHTSRSWDEGHQSGGTRWFTCTWPCPCLRHVARWSTGTWRDVGTSLLLGHRCLGTGRGYSVEVQTHTWSGTQAHYPRRGRAKAGPNISHEYLTAWGGVMLDRCFGSGQSFGMLLLGGFPKGKRSGVGWCPGWKASPATALPAAEGWDDAGRVHLWAERYSPGGREHRPPSRAPPLQCLPLCATLQCGADLVVNY